MLRSAMKGQDWLCKEVNEAFLFVAALAQLRSCLMLQTTP